MHLLLYGYISVDSSGNHNTGWSCQDVGQDPGLGRQAVDINLF